MTSIRIAVLDAAREAVTGRPASYGEPENSFGRVALVWDAIFPERRWTASDVALALAALKLVRLSFHIEHRDSAVDPAGYAACLAECATRESAL